MSTIEERPLGLALVISALPKNDVFNFPSKAESAVYRTDMIVERTDPRGHCAIREAAVEGRKSWF